VSREALKRKEKPQCKKTYCVLLIPLLTRPDVLVPIEVAIELLQRGTSLKPLSLFVARTDIGAFLILWIDVPDLKCSLSFWLSDSVQYVELPPPIALLFGAILTRL
jgi:hypothetical protein